MLRRHRDASLAEQRLDGEGAFTRGVASRTTRISATSLVTSCTHSTSAQRVADHEHQCWSSYNSRVGLVSTGWLARHFKRALLLSVVAAAVLTPTTDFGNMLVLAGPMILLYVVGIGLAWLFGTTGHAQRAVRHRVKAVRQLIRSTTHGAYSRLDRTDIISWTIRSVTFGSSPSVCPLSRRMTSATT